MFNDGADELMMIRVKQTFVITTLKINKLLKLDINDCYLTTVGHFCSCSISIIDKKYKKCSYFVEYYLITLAHWAEHTRPQCGAASAVRPEVGYYSYP